MLPCFLAASRFTTKSDRHIRLPQQRRRLCTMQLIGSLSWEQRWWETPAWAHASETKCKNEQICVFACVSRETCAPCHDM